MNYIIGYMLFFMIILISFILAMKILKSAIKATAITFVLLLLMSVILAYLMINDYKDIMENYDKRPSMVIIKNDKGMIAVSAIDFGKKGSENPFIRIDDENITKRDKKDLRSEYFRIVEIDETFITDGIGKELSFEIDGENYTLKNAQVKEILHSDEPYPALISAVAGNNLTDFEKEYIEDMLRNEKDFEGPKEAIIALAFKDIMNNKGVVYFIDGFREEKIKVYPETMIVKSIRYIPKSMIAGFVG